MVVAFDNNVVISASMFWTSIPARALRKAVKNNYKIVASQSTLAELKITLSATKFERYITLSKRIEFYEIFKSSLQIIPVTTSILACRDPKDNMFLELAVSSKADYIITGDKDLLELNPFRSTQIITPKEFVERIQ